jgi:hypothetical protein
MSKHEKFRIISNGDQFKVQEYWLWSWRDCPVAGRYTSILPGSIGIYEDVEDAEAAMNDLVGRYEKEKSRKSHGWREL